MSAAPVSLVSQPLPVQGDPMNHQPRISGVTEPSGAIVPSSVTSGRLPETNSQSAPNNLSHPPPQQVVHTAAEFAVAELLASSERLLVLQKTAHDVQRQGEFVARVAEAGVETVKKLHQAAGA